MVGRSFCVVRTRNGFAMVDAIDRAMADGLPFIAVLPISGGLG